jgi:hypothetical protein
MQTHREGNLKIIKAILILGLAGLLSIVFAMAGVEYRALVIHCFSSFVLY